MGADGGIVGSIVGGTFGVGISNHRRSAYHWLASNYEPGDVIVIYGFNRGAFPARRLGGFIGRGLLDLRGLTSKEAWTRVGVAFDAYQDEKKPTQSQWAKPSWPFYDDPDGTPIRFWSLYDNNHGSVQLKITRNV